MRAERAACSGRLAQLAMHKLAEALIQAGVLSGVRRRVHHPHTQDLHGGVEYIIPTILAVSSAVEVAPSQVGVSLFGYRFDASQ